MESKPDWDKIAEGKVRHGVVIALIGAKAPIKEWSEIDINDDFKELVNKLVTLIMTGGN